VTGLVEMTARISEEFPAVVAKTANLPARSRAKLELNCAHYSTNTYVSLLNIR
jgi:hypothetical protein